MYFSQRIYTGSERVGWGGGGGGGGQIFCKIEISKCTACL